MTDIQVPKKDEEGKRVDLFLKEKYPEYSRSYFAKLAKLGNIKVLGKTIKPSYELKEGDRVEVDLIEIDNGLEVKPADIPLDIIYEDKDVIVINKQPSLVVHPAVGNYENTLVNALVNYLPEIKNTIRDENQSISYLRPCLVHRLDKDTSGVIIVAKNIKTLNFLSNEIKDRHATKKYLAFCYGWPKVDNKELVNYLGRDPKNRLRYTEVGENKGRKAILRYKVKEYFETQDNKKLSLVEFDLKTGRTHQIRVQTKLNNFPVLGDDLYGTKESIFLAKSLGVKRQLLHSYYLKIKTSPTSEKTFIAPLPNDFLNLEDKLSTITT